MKSIKGGTVVYLLIGLGSLVIVIAGLLNLVIDSQKLIKSIDANAEFARSSIVIQQGIEFGDTCKGILNGQSLVIPTQNISYSSPYILTTPILLNSNLGTLINSLGILNQRLGQTKITNVSITKILALNATKTIAVAEVEVKGFVYQPAIGSAAELEREATYNFPLNIKIAADTIQDCGSKNIISNPFVCPDNSQAIGISDEGKMICREDAFTSTDLSQLDSLIANVKCTGVNEYLIGIEVDTINPSQVKAKCRTLPEYLSNPSSIYYATSTPTPIPLPPPPPDAPANTQLGLPSKPEGSWAIGNNNNYYYTKNGQWVYCCPVPQPEPPEEENNTD